MKKFLLSLAIASQVVSVAYTPSANAFGIVNILVTGRLDFVGSPRSYNDLLMTTLCIAFLPICILSNDGQDVTWSSQALLDNGYSQVEANAIIEGSQALASFVDGKSLEQISEVQLEKVPGMNSVAVEFLKEQQQANLLK